MGGCASIIAITFSKRIDALEPHGPTNLKNFSRVIERLKRRSGSHFDDHQNLNGRFCALSSSLLAHAQYSSSRCTKSPTLLRATSPP